MTYESYMTGLRYEYAIISLSIVYCRKTANQAIGNRIGMPGPNRKAQKLTFMTKEYL